MRLSEEQNKHRFVVGDVVKHKEWICLFKILDVSRPMGRDLYQLTFAGMTAREEDLTLVEAAYHLGCCQEVAPCD